MATPLGSRLKRMLGLGAVAVAMLLVLWWTCLGAPAQAGSEEEEAAEDFVVIDPLGPNSACYVCHMTFVREELSRVHLKEKVACIKCHGLSAAHANDEDIGATPPDKIYQRKEVDASCRECHEDHDVPGKKVVARYLERKLTQPAPICTDCHGNHKIEQPEEDQADDSAAAEPQHRGT